MHNTNNIEISTNNKTILNINNKLDNGNLTFEDIFQSDYGEYNEKDNTTADVLDPLVYKLKICLKKSEKGKLTQKKFDQIFIDNMDKVVDILLDKNRIKYGIYGTDETRWFLKDDTLKAPFNYFQQQAVLCVSGSVLEEISVKVVDKIMETNQDFVINFGILWSVYGNGNRLEKCFKKINNYINDRENDVFVKKELLSNQQRRVLKEILEMQSFENIITDGFTEYVAKSQIVSKCRDGLKKAKQVLDRDNKNINKQKYQKELHK